MMQLYKEAGLRTGQPDANTIPENMPFRQITLENVPRWRDVHTLYQSPGYSQLTLSRLAAWSRTQRVAMDQQAVDVKLMLRFSAHVDIALEKVFVSRQMLLRASLTNIPFGILFAFPTTTSQGLHVCAHSLPPSEFETIDTKWSISLALYSH